MLRITRDQSFEGTVVLKLEGKLLEAWLDELRGAIESSADCRSLGIDLTGLRFADAAGVALLRTLATQGASITGCSPFMAGLLDLFPGNTTNVTSPEDD